MRIVRKSHNVSYLQSILIIGISENIWHRNRTPNRKPFRTHLSRNVVKKPLSVHMEQLKDCYTDFGPHQL